MKIFDRKSNEVIGENGDREITNSYELGCGFYILLGLLLLAGMFVFGNGAALIIGSVFIVILFLLFLLS
jgi:hypothetical protein